jgi:hypothetical protein
MPVVLNLFRHQSSLASQAGDLSSDNRILQNMTSLPRDRRPKAGQQGPGETRHLWFALATLAAIFLSHPIAAAPTKEVRRILILNEENATYPGITIINQGIQAGLNDSPYQLQLYSEYMDT